MVIDQDIMTMVCLAMVDLKLTKQGFPSGQVGSHLLCAGGAVTTVNRESRDMIKKIGPWSSNTFLMYIHKKNQSYHYQSHRRQHSSSSVKLGSMYIQVGSSNTWYIFYIRKVKEGEPITGSLA